MGVIRNGKFYADEDPVPQQRSTTLDGIAQSGRIDREYENHAHDLIQPNNPDGSINQDFIDYYPEDAKNHRFIPESEQQ